MTGVVAPTVTEDLFSAATLEDPYPAYDRLRDAGPVHHLAAQDLYLVVRHAEVLEALDDPATFSSNLVGVLQVADEDRVGFLDASGAGAADVLATADPPAHTVQRRSVQGRFSRPSVEELRGYVESIVAPRVAALVEAGGGDWMSSLAGPLPVAVIGQLLGLPDDDGPQLAAWSDAGVELLSGTADGDRLGELGLQILAFMSYLRRHLDEARDGNAVGLLAEVGSQVEQGVLTEEEGVAMLLQLVTAGSESTTSLIGSAVRVVAQETALQDRLRANPHDVAPFVEEVLRLESPFRGHFRVTTRAATLGGVDLPAGARLMLLWGAANRDPEVFDAPGALDVDRPAVKSHTGFGRGIHFCLGAHLARLETVVAVRSLLAATDEVRLVDGTEPTHVPSLFVCRLASLPLRVSRASPSRAR